MIRALLCIALILVWLKFLKSPIDRRERRDRFSCQIIDGQAYDKRGF